jgi:hypothetical protein
MKKLFYSLLSFVIILISFHNPLQAQCNPGLKQDDLDVNFVSARLRAGGDLWWDLSAGRYIVPKTSQIASLFAGSLWMGGVDPGGGLHVAGQAYGAQIGAVDYYTGPLNANGSIDFQTCLQWDKMFEVSSADIQQHKADWATDHVIDGPIPLSVLKWPGRENPNFMSLFNFNLPAGVDLAPFYDRDEDGIYDPAKGDFPLVQGDQAFWWVYNDAGGPHDQTLGAPVGMEIQATAFSYESGVDLAEVTTFYEYKLIYKGAQALSDFYLSLWVDPDLGCWADDYVGCVPEENLGFVYNADALDENCSGLVGYQADIPVLGIKVLKSYAPGSSTSTGMSKFMYYFNTNAGMPVALTDPGVALEYYNYMSGKWRDGTPLSEGGPGYSIGAPAIDYAFAGNPADGNPWTECSANSAPGDRRFLMSFGPFDLQPGDIGELAFAVIWLPSQAHPCPDITPMVDAANVIKTFYEEKEEEILVTAKEQIRSSSVAVTPNPLTGEAVLAVNTPGLTLQSVQLFTTNGQMVREYAKLNSPQLTFSRNGLADGLYFYRALLSDGKIASGKVVFGRG